MADSVSFAALEDEAGFITYDSVCGAASPLGRLERSCIWLTSSGFLFITSLLLSSLE